MPSMKHCVRKAVFGGVTLAALAFPAVSYAALVISTDATSNVTCSSGVCSATAADAVLNVTDLTDMLASASLTVQSGGQAQDISIEAPFSWTSSNALTLDSYRAIALGQPVSDAGPAALNITTNDGGTGGMLSFRTKGRIHFTGTTNPLTINGQSFTLVNSVASLASAVSHRSTRNVALADNYDAGPDGTYPASPVRLLKHRLVEGLGNSIFGLTIDSASNPFTGLFGEVRDSIIADLGLESVSVKSSAPNNATGALAGSIFQTTVRNVHSSGSVTSEQFSFAGGLVGFGSALIVNSYSTAAVQNSGPGGLAGGLTGGAATLEQSFATGNVTGGTDTLVGGLVGDSGVAIDNCYALGTAATGDWDGGSGLPAAAGGLAGRSYVGPDQFSYSVGAPSGGSGSQVGGVIGLNVSAKFRKGYWNEKTSRTKNAVGSGDSSGLTGLTNKQLKAGLPAGFDPAIWAEDPKINHGYPYLIANPPPK